jgi:hypothetical protein
MAQRLHPLATALILFLILTALPLAGPAHALPGRAPLPAGPADLLDLLGSWLAAAWEKAGGFIDSHGQTATGDEGPFIDPDGQTATGDEGGFIDPDGQTATGDAGPFIDPNG